MLSVVGGYISGRGILSAQGTAQVLSGALWLMTALVACEEAMHSLLGFLALRRVGHLVEQGSPACLRESVFTVPMILLILPSPHASC